MLGCYEIISQYKPILYKVIIVSYDVCATGWLNLSFMMNVINILLPLAILIRVAHGGANKFTTWKHSHCNICTRAN
jgi:hypothetical protein